MPNLVLLFVWISNYTQNTSYCVFGTGAQYNFYFYVKKELIEPGALIPTFMVSNLVIQCLNIGLDFSKYFEDFIYCDSRASVSSPDSYWQKYLNDT